MFPSIKISGHICPEQMSAEELALKYKENFQSINADIVWVSLGLKQELFIEKICEEVNSNSSFVGMGGYLIGGRTKKSSEWLANIG